MMSGKVKGLSNIRLAKDIALEDALGNWKAAVKGLVDELIRIDTGALRQNIKEFIDTSTPTRLVVGSNLHYATSKWNKPDIIKLRNRAWALYPKILLRTSEARGLDVHLG